MLPGMSGSPVTSLPWRTVLPRSADGHVRLPETVKTMTCTDALADLVQSLPKAELHVHLEGTISAATAIRCAQRNNVELPWQSEEELTSAYDFPDLPGFLEVLWAAARTLRTRDDFYDMTIDYLRRAHLDNVVHAEAFFGAQTFLDTGVEIATTLDGVFEAIDDARTEWGIDAHVLCTAQRHREEATALELLDLIEPWRERILGVGLGGAERGNPPAKFARFFAEAKQRGYHRTIHAGEDAPSSYVEEALDLCDPERIDHGVAAAQDPTLLRRLRDAGMPLTVCPLSNLALGIIPSLQELPLAELLRAGVVATVNSDDPAFFGGYLNDNYIATISALDLTRDDVILLARNSIAASFMEDEEKARILGAFSA